MDEQARAQFAEAGRKKVRASQQPSVLLNHQLRESFSSSPLPPVCSWRSFDGARPWNRLAKPPRRHHHSSYLLSQRCRSK